MELLRVLSKFFNTAWHDTQRLFSSQSFSRTFLSRHCLKFSQACEWDLSLLDSSATRSPLRNSHLLSIFRCQVVNLVETSGVWSHFWCRRRINSLVTHTSRAFVQVYGVCLCSLSKEKKNIGFWKSKSFAFWFSLGVWGFFFLFFFLNPKPLPFYSSFPTSSVNIFLAPLQKFLCNSGAQSWSSIDQ